MTDRTLNDLDPELERQVLRTITLESIRRLEDEVDKLKKFQVLVEFENIDNVKIVGSEEFIQLIDVVEIPCINYKTKWYVKLFKNKEGIFEAWINLLDMPPLFNLSFEILKHKLAKEGYKLIAVEK